MKEIREKLGFAITDPIFKKIKDYPKCESGQKAMNIKEICDLAVIYQKGYKHFLLEKK
jgi:hypothetical protein